MKLKFQKPVYGINDRVIKCHIKFNPILENGKDLGERIVAGVATCNPTDKFKYETGIKIALARAESNAYAIGIGMMTEYYNHIDFVIPEIDKFFAKAKHCIKHNEEYIKEISK